MGQRNKEHFDEAKRGGTVSALYTSFPSKDSDTVKNAREMNIRPYPWKAYFEELIQICGIGRGGSVEAHLTSNYERGCSQKGSKGLLVWSKDTVDSLNGRRASGQPSFERYAASYGGVYVGTELRLVASQWEQHFHSAWLRKVRSYQQELNVV